MIGVEAHFSPELAFPTCVLLVSVKTRSFISLLAIHGNGDACLQPESQSFVGIGSSLEAEAGITGTVGIDHRALDSQSAGTEPCLASACGL